MTVERHLVVGVRLHGRFHGMGEGGPEWPPTPARVFQSMVAGRARGAELPPAAAAALSWLESLGPPTIVAPERGLGQEVAYFVPNNDADAASDPLDVSSLRVRKIARPRLLEAGDVVAYVWTWDGDDVPVADVSESVESLFQLGRGVDMAFAEARVIEAAPLSTVLMALAHETGGRVLRPSMSGEGSPLLCPCPGSLESLRARYEQFVARLQDTGETRSVRTLFRQPQKARFRTVLYGAPSPRMAFDLRSGSDPATFAPWPLVRVVDLATRIRDSARQRLVDAMPTRVGDIDRVLVGRRPDGSNAGPSDDRIRLLPLPSIGHLYADREVRRVLIDVPPGPIAADDAFWAFAGLNVADPVTGEIAAVLCPSEDESFLRHFGTASDATFRTWRTVTPVALPRESSRRRIEPTRRCAEAKAGAERSAEEFRAAAAVRAALRHAGIEAKADDIRVQREPWESREVRVERFADGTRFEKERLWHVEITLSRGTSGPLALGDGRFLGLGVMAPVRNVGAVFALAIESGLADRVDPVGLARALRRAVMARVGDVVGRARIPEFFSGHAPDGQPSRGGDVSHLAYAFDPLRCRLLVFSPESIERRPGSGRETANLRMLERVLDGFVELRAGGAGRLALRREDPSVDDDALLAPSMVWETVTPYVVNRHPKGREPSAAVMADVAQSCARAGLPAPAQCSVREVRGVSGLGLTARVRLEFAAAVRGPVLLGRMRFLGGGLFLGIQPSRQGGSHDLPID